MSSIDLLLNSSWRTTFALWPTLRPSPALASEMERLHLYYAVRLACIPSLNFPRSLGLVVASGVFQARTCHTKIRTHVGTAEGPGAESLLFMASSAS